MSFLNDLLTGGAQYYLGQEQLQDVEQLGSEARGQLQQLGQQVASDTQFRPFTVTTGLGTTTTSPTGGISVGLTPEQQALQNQLLQQAQGLFGQVGTSPAEAQADIYEQIRATQRPEEQRQRLALEERLLSQGRLGLQSAAYGGSSPELLALETARQEAMNRANLGARQQAMAEQAQALTSASGLMGAGYTPQQAALDALKVGIYPASMAQGGQLAGAELQSQLERSGLEAQLGMTQLGTEIRQQRDLGLMEALLGRQPTLQEIISGAEVGLSPEDLSLEGILTGVIGGLFGGGSDISDETNADLNSLIQYAQEMPSFEDYMASLQEPIYTHMPVL